MSTETAYDSRPATREHIRQVGHAMIHLACELMERAVNHDASKLVSPEVEAFDLIGDSLSNVHYGSPEYFAQLEILRPALNHHYAVNRHHPQYFSDGIQGMTLVDLLEMVVDWQCACKRHSDGDIYQSIETNQKRFLFSDELKQIFINTVRHDLNSDGDKFGKG